VQNEFIKALSENKELFSVDLSDDAILRLAEYFELVQEHNPILHLVGPCSPAEFATRHILESLTLLENLPKSGRFADVGSGSGLPAIPCLLVRDDLSATLIDAKKKKSDFLNLAVESLGLTDRVSVVMRQFHEVQISEEKTITCRALDKFSEKLPALLKWSRGRRRLFFGGPTLEAKLRELGRPFERKLMPLSDQRYLFNIK
jgi:Predicted S-adenosylmethionine-dependent methyltransferase involved in bacterial cell division